jgi:2-succinyl-6-hydroxy-2,4-cyclohexadiene-1-carboxylate synthase
MILALHGNLGGPGDWDELRARLPGERFVTPCLWEERIVSLREAGHRLGRWAAEPGAVLLGYSLGARLAMHAVLAGGSRWAGAVFVSGHPGSGDAGARRERCRTDAEWARRFAAAEPGAVLAAWNAQPVFGGAEPAPDQEAIVRCHRDRIARAFRRWSWGRQEDLVPRLAGCAIPTLWVVGSEDRKFAAEARRAVSAIPGAAYQEIEGCGHRVPLQKPEPLAECVLRFLETVRNRSAAD